MTTVRISFADLRTYGIADSGATKRAPLSQLGEPKNAGHIHGRLTIEIGGRSIPRLRFFGPDDVCFDAWLVELCGVLNALESAAATHTFRVRRAIWKKEPMPSSCARNGGPRQ